MPAHNEKSPVPDWAQRERAQDLAWIRENLDVFWPAAQQGFKTAGRGAIVVETVKGVKHEGGEGNPFIYVPTTIIQEEHWADVMRLVNEYDPTWEFVTVLLKHQRESAYRIGIPAAQVPSGNQRGL